MSFQKNNKNKKGLFIDTYARYFGFLLVKLEVIIVL